MHSCDETQSSQSTMYLLTRTVAGLTGLFGISILRSPATVTLCLILTHIIGHFSCLTEEEISI